MTQYTKRDLQELIDRVRADDSDAVEKAVAFTLQDSLGLWHGRGRAKICRTLKNRPPAKELQDKLVETIIRRLRFGTFSEQFKDQLAMAIRFDQERMSATATDLLDARKEYVRRYARWVLHVIDSMPDGK